VAKPVFPTWLIVLVIVVLYIVWAWLLADDFRSLLRKRPRPREGRQRSILRVLALASSFVNLGFALALRDNAGHGVAKTTLTVGACVFTVIVGCLLIGERRFAAALRARAATGSHPSS
jgi:hypothetical protein